MRGGYFGNGYRVACDGGMRGSTVAALAAGAGAAAAFVRKGSQAFGAGQQSAGGDVDDDASIVGLWQFAFSSAGNSVPPFNIPDKAPLDAGYAQWHSDGTEIMNSSRDPATSKHPIFVLKIGPIHT